MRLKWPGFNDKGTVLIKLDSDSFCLSKKNIEINGDTFTPKDEILVTLIGTKLGSIILDKIKQDKTIDSLLGKIFEDIDWSFEQTGPVHILSRKKDKILQKSIIMLIKMHGVKVFYEQLISLGLMDVEIPVPPAHVTMYTHNCPLGIGVPNQKMLNILSRKTLTVNELHELCNN